MLDKITSWFFSIKAMTLGLFIFLTSIGIATFIESSEGIQSAKLWIYNALWFELLLVFLAINLLVNIFRYRMWRREKIAVLMFHLSFIVIIIGAGITRYISFEGRMNIRVGESNNTMVSADPYFIANVNDGTRQASHEAKAFMAESVDNHSIDAEFNFQNRKNPVSVTFYSFESNCRDTIEINAEKYKTAVLEIVTEGKKSNYLLNEEVKNLQNFDVAFSKETVEGVNFYQKNGKTMLKSSMLVRNLAMTKMRQYRQSGQEVPDSVYVKIVPNTEVEANPMTLYIVGEQQFVFKGIIPNAGKTHVKVEEKNAGNDYLTVKITDGNKSKLITLNGGLNKNIEPRFFSFNGINYNMQYGSKPITIPFFMKCNKFEIVRQPGSDMAASYSSNLQAMDTARNFFGTKKIIMNRVWDYEGYRFFQSSYDEDEKGTILSVNHDWWGTNVTYLGYMMLFIGMIFSLFMPSSRFVEILKKLSMSNKIAILLAAMIASSYSFSQDQKIPMHSTQADKNTLGTTDEHAGHNHELDEHEGHNHKAEMPEEKSSKPVSAMGPDKNTVYVIDKDHADKLARLLVLDEKGRHVPFHTICTNIMFKLYRKEKIKINKFEDELNAVQVVMSAQMYQNFWMEQKMILVPSVVRDKLKLEKYVSFVNLTMPNGDFKYIKEYQTAFRKGESKQSEFEKKLIKLADKHVAFVKMISWQYFKALPLLNHPNRAWESPLSSEITVKDSSKVGLFVAYLSALYANQIEHKPLDFSMHIDAIKSMQRQSDKVKELPSEAQINLEVSYNKMHIFKNSMNSYFIIGFFLLILFFLRLLLNSSLKRDRIFNFLRKIVVFITIVIFVYHGLGLCFRWYISGHAPWSDGYEALVWIAWMTMVAGFIGSRINQGVLGGAALLSACMIFVSEMQLLDPQITPLAPVLQSYWLKIHVSIITASYAFLGVTCIISLINILLFLFRNKENGARVTKNINTLSSVSELMVIIGLFMLTIGTFLGGIWANESWGRYWAWDPKETWALVSVLVYAILMHLRYIPGLSSKLVFNIGGLFAYAAIMFTFFGVNFILVGLHSYANGDGSVSLPTFVWVIVLFLVVLCVIAARLSKRYNKQIKENL